MRRFASLRFVAAETRRILRDRFRRYLPVMHQAQNAPDGGNLISDEQWLDLLLNLEIASGSDIDHARAAYDAALPAAGGEPTFDQVIAAGWLRVVWGRITAPFEIDQRARAAPGGNLTALAALLKDRFKEKYTFRKAVRDSAELGSLVAEIERGDKAPDSVHSRSPNWVAARLGIVCCPPPQRAAPTFAGGSIAGVLSVGLPWWRIKSGARQRPKRSGSQCSASLSQNKA
jgi:hypothetical protein